MEAFGALVVVTFLFGLMIYIAIRFWVFVFKSLSGHQSQNTSPSQSSETGTTPGVSFNASSSDDEKPPTDWDKPDWLRDEERQDREERYAKDWDNSLLKKAKDFFLD